MSRKKTYPVAGTASNPTPIHKRLDVRLEMGLYRSLMVSAARDRRSVNAQLNALLAMALSTWFMTHHDTVVLDHGEEAV